MPAVATGPLAAKSASVWPKAARRERPVDVGEDLTEPALPLALAGHRYWGERRLRQLVQGRRQAEVVLHMVADLVGEHERVRQMAQLKPGHLDQRDRQAFDRAAQFGVAHDRPAGVGRVRGAALDGERGGHRAEKRQRRLPDPLQRHIVRSGPEELGRR